MVNILNTTPDAINLLLKLFPESKNIFSLCYFIAVVVSHAQECEGKVTSSNDPDTAAIMDCSNTTCISPFGRNNEYVSFTAKVSLGIYQETFYIDVDGTNSQCQGPHITAYATSDCQFLDNSCYVEHECTIDDTHALVNVNEKCSYKCSCPNKCTHGYIHVDKLTWMDNSDWLICEIGIRLGLL